MKLKLRDKYICIEEVVIITLFLCFLSNNARGFLYNYFICYLYISFHELAHILIASVFGYELKRINIRLAGMNAVFRERFLGIKGIAIYLAGPISNIILAILFRKIKIVYEINMALALINILPIGPLDGYNILNLILNIFVNKEKVKNIMNSIKKIVEIALIILAVFMWYKYHNFSLFLLLVYIKTNFLQPLKSL